MVEELNMRSYVAYTEKAMREVRWELLARHTEAELAEESVLSKSASKQVE